MVPRWYFRVNSIINKGRIYIKHGNYSATCKPLFSIYWLVLEDTNGDFINIVIWYYFWTVSNRHALIIRTTKSHNTSINKKEWLSALIITNNHLHTPSKPKWAMLMRAFLYTYLHHRAATWAPIALLLKLWAQINSCYYRTNNKGYFKISMLALSVVYMCCWKSKYCNSLPPM